MKLFDTSVLILFLDYIPDINCINILCDFGEDINITPEVYNEYSLNNESSLIRINHSDVENSINHYIDNNKIKIIKKEIESIKDKIRTRHPTLGKGEISIIALGILLNNNDYYCVLDDKTARDVAIKYNLQLTGSIGLMIKIRDEDTWDDDELSQIVEKIRSSDFRVSDEILGRLYDKS